MSMENASPRLYNEDLAPATGAQLGSVQHLQRLDLGRAQPLGLLPRRQPVSHLRQSAELHHRHRRRLAGHLPADEPCRLRRRQDRRALSGAGARLLRHVRRQPAGPGARHRRLLLVRRADERGLGRAGGAADAQPRDGRLQPQFAPARPFDARSHHVRHRLGAATAHHPARHGDGAEVPGLGGPGGLGDDADSRRRADDQGRRHLLRRRHSARRPAEEDRRRRGSRRARLVRGAGGGGGDLDHLFRRALPQLLRLLALRAEQARGAHGQSLGPAGQPDPVLAGRRHHHDLGLRRLPRGAAASGRDLGALRFLGAGADRGADLRGGDARHQRGGEFRLAGLRFLQCVPVDDQLQARRLYRRPHRAGALSLRAVGRAARRVSSA